MRTPPPLPRPLVGVPFTLSQAQRHGVDALRLRAGDIHHPFHGVNLSYGPGELQELCRAYLRVMPMHAFFSHTTAAELLGIPLPADAPRRPLHVSVLSPRTAPHGRGVTGHSLREIEGMDVSGLPVSMPAHVWCQLSGMLGPSDLVAAGDHLVGARNRPPIVTIDQLAETSARVRRTKGGKARAWALSRIRFGTDSRPESLLRLFLEELGITGLRVNEPVLVADGRVLHPDLALPDQRIAFEYDGDGHRVERRQWFLDIKRHDLLVAAGWRVLRVTADDLFADRAAFVQRLQRFAPNLGIATPKTEIWRKS
ncbi:Very-short-patch-repair endonuclease [Leifsonia sp. 98AMF]|uniref:endonuclease domain-containing protein n=1 Tax=unclassified Leifsonia TaxID=2663824 RepID=UPI00087C476D|nr:MULTISPECIES: hypothetical protein [unclassified Leifsonia]SDI93688.1 Very-short-patch-repair endonuclease [Leifsonia sp. 466MF]SDN97446.1 Very-short-patch-repair endonuclease [Leifsonia sp. 509MF]SEN07848.1 Very-short-patch-repair endonuclease [Leifsonia sp. 467MF]SFM08847.1 Very-short-patch-repair endonuclease [Leifsonia sp. 98AMF]